MIWCQGMEVETILPFTQFMVVQQCLSVRLPRWLGWNSKLPSTTSHFIWLKHNNVGTGDVIKKDTALSACNWFVKANPCYTKLMLMPPWCLLKALMMEGAASETAGFLDITIFFFYQSSQVEWDCNWQLTF